MESIYNWITQTVEQFISSIDIPTAASYADIIPSIPSSGGLLPPPSGGGGSSSAP
jgi:hypothetical protein